MELKIKTKWRKFTLHTDHHTRMEKYRPWQKVSCHRIHTKRRPSSHDRTSRPYLKCSTDSGTFINSGPMGYPPKTFGGSDMHDDLLLHISDLEDYCSTCLTKKVRYTCKPMSDWNGDLIDITQPDPSNPNNTTTIDREDRQDQALLSDRSDQDNFWSSKTYDKVRPLTLLKPVPVLSPSKGDEDSKWSKHLHLHNYWAKAPSQVTPLNLLQVCPKVSGLTQPHTR